MLMLERQRGKRRAEMEAAGGGRKSGAAKGRDSAREDIRGQSVSVERAVECESFGEVGEERLRMFLWNCSRVWIEERSKRLCLKATAKNRKVVVVRACLSRVPLHVFALFTPNFCSTLTFVFQRYRRLRAQIISDFDQQHACTALGDG